MSKTLVTIILALAGIASLLAACNSQPLPPTVNPGPVTTPATPNPDGEDIPVPPLPSTTPTREVRILQICTGPEPASLFPYSSPSASSRSILQAIYDGPIDNLGFELSPVILEQIPSLENGEAFFEPGEVMVGEIITDTNGEIGPLREGTVYRPSGCRSSECAITYSGSGPVQTDILAVRFRLLPDLKWSDGSPLTAQDSEYAFQVAQAVYPAYRPEIVRLTSSYQSIDGSTLEWRGLPGSQYPSYAETFFSPLPQQAWASVPASELAGSELANRNPLGWGPYLIEEWVAGESLSLVKNPHYFKADQDLPNFDRLIFRFTASSSEAIQALQAGECDLAEDASLKEISLSELQSLGATAGITVFTVPGAGWEQILFAAVPGNQEQPAFFSSAQVRQALAACIDREAIVQELYPGQTFIPDSLLLPEHPLYYAEVARYPYNPQAASDLLSASGWIDHDNDPQTPRLAQGVPGVIDGTPFEFTYLASNEAERERSASMIVADLAECGIRANLSLGDSSQVYAGGPEGPVFGRRFDAAQLAWQTYWELPCTLFSSNEIPGPPPEFIKGWGGANASGFSNLDYDRACRTRLTALPGDPALTSASHQVQQIFAEQLPALPLYVHLRVAAGRTDLCGFQIDPSNINSLWNLEAIDYGESCQP